MLRLLRAAVPLVLCVAPVGFGTRLALAQDATPAPEGSGFGPDTFTGSGLRGSGALTDDAGTPAPPAAIDPNTGLTPPDATAPQRPALRSTIAPQPLSTAKARVGPPKLPALAAYPSLSDSAKLRAATLGAFVPPVGPTTAALPLDVRRRPKPDPAPFAPIGYTIGTVRLTPFIEQSLGFDSNPDQTAVGVKSSAFSRTEGGFDLLSLWSSNELRANMHGAYDDFFSNPAANRPDAAGTIDYRFDATRDIALDAEGRFAITTQRPGSPELNVAVKDRPLVSSFGTSIGGSDTFGRLTLALHGTFDRTMYENGILPDGTVIPLGDQTFNAYGVIGRASYELTPGFKPFVEVGVDTRVHDQRIDNSGYARDSEGILGRVGSTFEFSRLLVGQLSAGYENRSYDDRRLRDLKGPLVDGSLSYFVTNLTSLTLLAATSFNETTVAGSPGSESRSVSLQVSHALMRNLILTGTLTYLNTNYISSPIVENTLSETFKASYSLNRSIVLDATYSHQRLNSTAVASSFSQDVFMVGLRLQH
ncbi:outer membrane beta-barrel protein [Lichenihabitans psoromatis]|uniref:outer membrane beta-barrel protein n=1 Tax=Lichenihabitans psoromatis TaxID=2528642 RepID=UPI0013F15CE1|nr:outer membrane beta-barrel protein [Lichenihabitans psoromatis]